LHQRYSTGLSGIPLVEYFAPFASECEFSRETLRIVEFLIANRRTFKERAEAGINDARQVAEFARLCRAKISSRAICVYLRRPHGMGITRDRPTRWFNTRELYAKTLQFFRPAADPTRGLHAAGYSPEQLNVLKDFGEDFFGGVYRSTRIVLAHT